ncbi:MAG TPA: DNA-formamidopyrimidine glycosylase family protein [Acidimicrobiia bacterium]|nr:DNA-formamidopyrimidine glycosylase family protein [Acidimicrobiia bacterium]
MPEGDTIFRAARALDRILTGRRVVRFEVRSGRGGPRPAAAAHPPRPGELVTSVEAQGKHLLIAFDGGTTLHTHMQMTGSWHAYRPGERWQKKPAAARVVLEVADPSEPDVVVAVAVCFSAPVVELVGAPAAHPRLSALGPDLCRPDADLAEAAARLGRLPGGTEIGVALLDQRVACGVGNVYKSETLFACGVDPFAPVEALDGGARRRLLETAARQLQANLDGSAPRSTVTTAGGGRGLAVYGRAGRPCRRCGTRILSRRQGDAARTTYWCPTCQPAAGTPDATAP